MTFDDTRKVMVIPLVLGIVVCSLDYGDLHLVAQLEAVRVLTVELCDPRLPRELQSVRIDAQDRFPTRHHERRMVAWLDPLGSTVPETRRTADFVCYGVASSTAGDKARTLAELYGRQLLIMACGVEVRVEGGKVTMSGRKSIAGVRTTEVTDRSGYLVVRLDASIERSGITHAPGAKMEKHRICREAALATAFEDITEVVGMEMGSDIERSDQFAHDDGGSPDARHLTRKRSSRGFLVLIKIDLIGHTLPPKCRYVIELTRAFE